MGDCFVSFPSNGIFMSNGRETVEGVIGLGLSVIFVLGCKILLVSLFSVTKQYVLGSLITSWLLQGLFSLLHIPFSHASTQLHGSGRWDLLVPAKSKMPTQ